MNKNTITTDRCSNDDSQRLCELQWPDQPQVREQYLEGRQCGGCSYVAPFNCD